MEEGIKREPLHDFCEPTYWLSYLDKNPTKDYGSGTEEKHDVEERSISGVAA